MEEVEANYKFLNWGPYQLYDKGDDGRKMGEEMVLT